MPPPPPSPPRFIVLQIVVLYADLSSHNGEAREKEENGPGHKVTLQPILQTISTKKGSGRGINRIDRQKQPRKKMPDKKDVFVVCSSIGSIGESLP